MNMRHIFDVQNSLRSDFEHPTFIDMFAGIGGIHLGFHEAGAKCVLSCEIDEYARLTYHRNMMRISPKIFEKNNFFRDINDLDINKIPYFNILAGGFPCQAFSHAGKRMGFQDVRGSLFFKLAEILDQKRPDAFFFENVRGLLNHDDGHTFTRIREIIRELGYSFNFKLIKASDFGVPQHRPRVYMVGFRDKDIQFSFPQSVPLDITMSDIFNSPCEKKIGFTLRVGGRKSPYGDRRNWDTYMVDGNIRVIGPEEALKMQGFPNWFSFDVPDCHSMKQLGNSVAVPVVAAIAKEIVKSLKKSMESKESVLMTKNDILKKIGGYCF